jgi:hypothetical protein
MDDLQEVIYVTNGIFEFGFEINEQNYFVLKFTNSSFEWTSEKHDKSKNEPMGFYKSSGKAIN